MRQLFAGLLALMLLVQSAFGATATFHLTDPAFLNGGEVVDMPNAGNPIRQFAGQNSGGQFVATGTDCTILGATGTTIPVYQCSIDGGTAFTLTLPVNTTAPVTLFTGLPDAPHSVRFWHASGTTQRYISWIVTNGISVTGATPSIGAHPMAGAVYDVKSLPADKFVIGGYTTPQGYIAGYQSLLNLAKPDASIRFTGNPTELYAWGVPSAMAVFQDGVRLTPIAPSGGLYTYQPVATGLDGLTHEYEIVATTPVTYTGIAARLKSVLLTGGDVTTTPTPRPQCLFIGDSITAGTGVNDSSLCWPRRTAMACGYDTINHGIPSIRLLPYSGQSVAQLMEILPTIYAAAANRDIQRAVILIGRNDAYYGSASVSDLGQGWAMLLRYHQRQLPGVKTLVLGILPTAVTPAFSTARVAFNTELQTQVTNLADPNIVYVNTDANQFTPAFNPAAGQDTTDKTHLSTSGNTKLVNLLTPLLP